MKEQLNKILQQIYKTMRGERVKFITFCLDRGHSRKDIAKALGMTRNNLNVFILRYIKGGK